MKYRYYVRIVTKRVKINRFGKLGYKTFSECVYTDDIKPYNYGKKIRFKPITCTAQVVGSMCEIANNPNKVYSFEIER